MSKICEKYYGSNPYSSNGNGVAWSHTAAKFKKTLAKEFVVLRSLRIIKFLL